MLLFQNLINIKQAFKTDDGENGRKIVSGFNDLKRLQKPFFSWNILIVINIVWWDN